jgi:PTH1 family peptidyl-tRNA hydrolase
MWTLIPLGNPGPEYAGTRHNLGRLLVLRWMDAKGIRAEVLGEYRTGTLYGLSAALQALVPATYMNLSGQVLEEALAVGMDPARMVALHDDKDLPLGLGRLRPAGSDGGHNGMRSLLEVLGTEVLPRLRLGIGPFTRPLHEFVLGTWSEPELETLERLDAPFAAFLALLEECEELDELPAKVNAPAFWQGDNQPPVVQD